MTQWIKLTPDERLLIESGINRYKVVGPDLVWIMPWQRPCAKLYIGPNFVPVECRNARVSDDVPVNVSLTVTYRVNPDLFTADLLPRLPRLNEGGWRSFVQLRTEAVVRRLLARLPWRELKENAVQTNLETQFSKALIGAAQIWG